MRSTDPNPAPEIAKYYVWNHIRGGPSSLGCLLVDKDRSNQVAHIFGDPETGTGISWYFSTEEFTAAQQGLSPDAFRTQVEHVSVAAEDQYYNSIKIKGESRLQPEAPYAMELTDWDSVHGHRVDGTPYGLGYKKQRQISYPWAINQGIVDTQMRIAYFRHAYCGRYITVRAPYDMNYMIGDTFQIWGWLTQHMYLNGRTFRIVSINDGAEAANQLPSHSELRGVEIFL
jgi:hypothetical protein